LGAIVTGGLVGFVLEKSALSKLYQRDHLDHVLATFGLVMFFNEIVRVIWGPQPLFVTLPEYLLGTIEIFDVSYPIYRFLIIVVGLIIAIGSQWLIHQTRLGMLIRAGSINPTMVGALGVNIKLLNTMLFVLGSILAALAGSMAAPILSVQSGMGETVLIVALVVIVVGGIGSVHGAFYAALIIGMTDTLGRSYLPLLLRELFDRDMANAVAPALASMLIYLLMAVILAFRPQGLFPAHKAR
jgi:branched-chain amino acid transport system permease protein